MPSVAIVLVNWNGWRDSLECLESVMRLDYPGVRIIVCDNASTNNSMEQFEAWASGNLEVEPANAEMANYTRPSCAEPIECIFLDRSVAERATDDVDTTPKLTLIQTVDNLGFAGGNNV